MELQCFEASSAGCGRYVCFACFRIFTVICVVSTVPVVSPMSAGRRRRSGCFCLAVVADDLSIAI